MGDDCNTPKRNAQEQIREESSSAGIAWGVSVSLILVGVIVFVLLYYRRRIKDLKTTIADVEFHANPQTQPDRHHFDNPVYAFQTNGSTDNTQLLNNLRPSKPTNLERYKLGFSDTDSNASSRGCNSLSIFEKSCLKYNKMNLQLEHTQSISTRILARRILTLI